MCLWITVGCEVKEKKLEGNHDQMKMNANSTDQGEWVVMISRKTKISLFFTTLIDAKRIAKKKTYHFPSKSTEEDLFNLNRSVAVPAKTCKQDRQMRITTSWMACVYLTLR